MRRGGGPGRPRGAARGEAERQHVGHGVPDHGDRGQRGSPDRRRGAAQQRTGGAATGEVRDRLGERGDRQPRRADGHQQRQRGREVVPMGDEQGHQHPDTEHRQRGCECFACHTT